MRTLSFLVLIAMLTAGCASVPMSTQEADRSAKRFLPTAGYSGLYIVRSGTDWRASQEAAPVWVDGHRIGGLPVNGFFALDVDPGEHRITTQSAEHHREVRINIIPGGCGFVEISFGYGWNGVRWTLNAIPPSSGRDMIRKGERVAVQH